VILEEYVKSVFTGIMLIGLFGGLQIGCVAQKADVARIQKDLEQQISQLKSEKIALGQQVEETRSAIAESQNQITAQKADMNKLRSDLAPLNQQIKLLRDKDLTSLYGQIEMTEKRVSDLRQNFVSQTEKFGGDIQALQTTAQAQGERQQLSQTQADALAQQIDEKNQALTKKMTEFQTAFGQFKKTLGSLGTDISQTQTDIGTIKTDLTTQDQALRTFLEQDVKTAMDQLVADMDARQRPVLEKIDALQADVEALGIHVQADATQVQGLSQSVVKLREAQEVMGSLLGKRGDEILQQAGGLSERMNNIESHQATLTQQLQSNTNKTSVHLTEVNDSLTSISQSLDQTTQSLTQRLTQQEKTVATLNQAIQQFQHLKDETQGQIQQMQTAGQLTDQLRQNAEQINARLQDLEIHQSGLVGKLDSDAQTTTTHLKEVNKGIKSVAQALESVNAKLNTRIVRLEQQLNRAMTTFQGVQGSADVAQTNVQHLNDLTETMNQLQEVINTIGTKLGERVDEHEDRLGQLAQRVNHLQGTKQKK